MDVNPRAETEPVADAELFYGLYNGVFKPQLVKVAIQLGFFDPLAKQSLNGQGLAHALRAHVTGVERLADYLAAIGLIEKSSGLYSLTPTAKTFLVRTSEAYAGDLLLGFTSSDFCDQLIASIRTGNPQSLLERFDQDAWVESYRKSRIISSLDMWKAAGVPKPDQSFVRILDLASGCGIKTFSLARVSPKVTVTCLDSPYVLKAAKDLAERSGITDRVIFIDGDILSISLGVNRYEACLAGQITHYLTHEQNRQLFTRIHDALVPEGVFVLDVPLGQDKLDETIAFLSLVLWSNSGGKTYTFEEYKELLQESGFRSARRAGSRWIIAEK